MTAPLLPEWQTPKFLPSASRDENLEGEKCGQNNLIGETCCGLWAGQRDGKKTDHAFRSYRSVEKMGQWDERPSWGDGEDHEVVQSFSRRLGHDAGDAKLEGIDFTLLFIKKFYMAVQFIHGNSGLLTAIKFQYETPINPTNTLVSTSDQPLDGLHKPQAIWQNHLLRAF